MEHTENAMSPVVARQRSKRCTIEEESLMPSMKTTRHYTKEGARHGANNLQLSYIAWSKLFENRTIKEATLQTRTGEPTQKKHKKKIDATSRKYCSDPDREERRDRHLTQSLSKKKGCEIVEKRLRPLLENKSIKEATGKTRLNLQSMTKQENIDAS